MIKNEIQKFSVKCSKWSFGIRTLKSIVSHSLIQIVNVECFFLYPDWQWWYFFLDI